MTKPDYNRRLRWWRWHLLLAYDNGRRRGRCGWLQVPNAHLLFVHDTLMIRSHDSNRIGVLIDLIRGCVHGILDHGWRVDSNYARTTTTAAAHRCRIRVGVVLHVRVGRRLVVVVLQIRAVVLVGTRRTPIHFGERNSACRCRVRVRCC